MFNIHHSTSLNTLYLIKKLNIYFQKYLKPLKLLLCIHIKVKIFIIVIANCNYIYSQDFFYQSCYRQVIEYQLYMSWENWDFLFFKFQQQGFFSIYSWDFLFPTLGAIQKYLPTYPGNSFFVFIKKNNLGELLLRNCLLKQKRECSIKNTKKTL